MQIFKKDRHTLISAVEANGMNTLYSWDANNDLKYYEMTIYHYVCLFFNGDEALSIMQSLPENKELYSKSNYLK